MAGGTAFKAEKLLKSAFSFLGFLAVIQKTAKLNATHKIGAAGRIGLQTLFQPSQHRIFVQAEQGGDFLHAIRPGRLYQARVVVSLGCHALPA
jgi:hypothetical protein